MTAPAWQRAPFEHGHELSVRHGAYSPRKIDPQAERLVGHLLALAESETSAIAHLAKPEYRPAVLAWAREEARCQLLAEAEMAAVEAGQPVPSSIEQALHRAESRAASRRTELGLTPMAYARLRRDLADANHAASAAAQLAAVAEERRRKRAEGGDD